MTLRCALLTGAQLGGSFRTALNKKELAMTIDPTQPFSSPFNSLLDTEEPGSSNPAIGIANPTGEVGSSAPLPSLSADANTTSDGFESVSADSGLAPSFEIARGRGRSPQGSITLEMQSHGSRYDAGMMQFGRLTTEDKNTLLNRVDQGRVSFGTFANALDTLQRYTDYDNQKMLALVGEALYSDALDPFTPQAGDFDRATLRELTQNGSQNGVSQSQAQLALDTLLLTSVTHRDRATGASRPPALVVDPPADYPNSLIDWPSGDFGIDHILAGAMGDRNGVTDIRAGIAIDNLAGRLGGPHVDLTGNDANTWVGDLVAVVAESGVRSLYETGAPGGEDSAAVYRNEFPAVDQISDILGAPFEVFPDRHNLGAALTEYLEPFGTQFQNKFTHFADSVGVQYNDQGQITNRENFVQAWSPTVSAMAFGFVADRADVQALIVPDVPFDGGSAAQTERFQEVLEFGEFQARGVLDRWLDYVEQGLVQENR